ncbi:MAG: hypothetical protein WCO66_01180 [Candidatus Absconditabacteria bacterium]
MDKKKFKLSLDQWLLGGILVILAIASAIFQYKVAKMNIYAIGCLALIGIIFDGFIAFFYRRFRLWIKRQSKKYPLSYYTRETTPFLLIFGGAYALKIAVIAFFSIFVSSLALSSHSVKVSIGGMVVATLAFAWLFRKLTRWVYKKSRAIEKEHQQRKLEQLQKIPDVKGKKQKKSSAKSS